jgi:hypothetical protein
LKEYFVKAKTWADSQSWRKEQETLNNTNQMKKLQIYIASDDSHVLKAAQAE